MDRAGQLHVAHEHMLAGMLVNRAVPQVVSKTGRFDEMNDVAIDLWMGASPNYTLRMRALMGIEGLFEPAATGRGGRTPARRPARTHRRRGR